METFYEDLENLPDVLTGSMVNFQEYIYVAVTVSFPETKAFMALTSIKQKRLYKFFYTTLIGRLGAKKIVSSKTVYEFTKKGKVHMHSILRYPRVPSEVGLIADMAKISTKLIAKRFKEECLLNNEYGITYRDAGLCFDIIYHIDNYKRWIDYLYKSIVVNANIVQQENKNDSEKI